MSSIRLLQSLVAYTFLLAPASVSAQSFVTAGQIPADLQTWGFGASSRCRVLAHKSVILKDDDHFILVIDGGFGQFQTQVNGSKTRVLDLNPFTAAFDLSKDFSTPGLEPLWYYRKPPNSTQRFTLTNHGGLWASADQKTIWYQGGHYFNAQYWNDGLYHVSKEQIPPWQLWQMDVTQYKQGWVDVTNETQGHEVANRTFAGTAVSVPNMKANFWLGGILDRTTSANSPNDTLETSPQMLTFNQTTRAITRSKYYQPDSTKGNWQGSLVHLPIGPGNGYLISLMSLEKTLNTPWVDPDGEGGNIEVGEPVTLDSIPLYDLDKGEWFEQSTSWYMDQIPGPRTRFCSALFHDASDNSWQLWVHGGQLLSSQSDGISEIYVLHMPSFIWTKVYTTLPDTNLIRSHTCHAVGSQLIIVGGYPPGLVEATNVTCDPEYLKVLNIGEKTISWTGAYTPNTQYKTPTVISNVVGGRTTPMANFANAQLAQDFQYKSKSRSQNAGPIAGGVVGGVVIIALVIGAWWLLRRRRRAARTRQNGGPASPRYGQPEALKDGNVPDSDRRTAQHVTEIYPFTHAHEQDDPSRSREVSLPSEKSEPRSLGPYHELESPSEARGPAAAMVKG